MHYIISTIILSYGLYIYHKYTEINVHTEKKDILLVCDAVYICGVTRKYNEIYNRLIREWKFKYNLGENINSDFFPLYRCKL